MQKGAQFQSLFWPFSRRRLGNTPAGQKEHPTDQTSSENVVFIKFVFYCLSSSPPRTVLPPRTALLSLFFQQGGCNWDRHSIPHCLPFLGQFHVPAGHSSPSSLQKGHYFPFRSEANTPFHGEQHITTLCSIAKKSSW